MEHPEPETGDLGKKNAGTGDFETRDLGKKDLEMKDFETWGQENRILKVYYKLTFRNPLLKRIY